MVEMSEDDRRSVAFCVLFQVILFLKMFDGYPEPISLNFRWSIFGFYWQQIQNGNMAMNSRKILPSILSDNLES